MSMKQLSWGVDVLEDNPIHYPIRMLRYWFMYHFLREEAARNGPLDVCEIGVDVGQMLGFVNAALDLGGDNVPLASWDAVDCLIRRDVLERAGYKNFHEVDLESAEFRLDANKQYDAMILLHVLEHLFNPEGLIPKLVRHVKPGGMLIGGFPSTPNFLAQSREDAIRPRARKFGHVSVFSPTRVRHMAAANGLEVEFLSGAFFMRKKGFLLEHYRWWLRFNLWFGSLLPSWPGEIYWILRKPAGGCPPRAT